jgi:cysteine synthase
MQDKLLQDIETIKKTIASTSLHRLSDFDFPLYAKIESNNPVGSIKIKPALEILHKHIKLGHITSGSTVCDASSGNFGLSLAYLCSRLGLGCVIITSPRISEMKYQKILSYGAEVKKIGDEYDGCLEEIIFQLSKDKKKFVKIDQTMDQANPDSHFNTTAIEVLAQWPKETKLSHVFASIGTGGTLIGIGRKLKSVVKDISIIGIDNENSVYYKTHIGENLDELDYGLLKIEGVGDISISKIFDWSIIDQIVGVSNKSAYNGWQELLRLGYSVGPSSGLAYTGIKNFIREYGRPDGALVIFPDSSYGYDSLEL